MEDLAASRGIDAGTMRSAIAAGRPGLLQRFIEPSEIANLVLYLASPVSSATNGATLRAEGGVLPTTL
ncbi:SDR family oxidoreductase [uncultured Amnibacterium sp.]|uniref:SDR family oxidoreductase n=1 Tax=uncultured Amnibacterium sp. TaxID=1631851 RepID=UPI0035C9988F